MTSRIRRQLTAAIALCLVHLAFVAPTLGVERPVHPTEVRAPWTAEPAATDAEHTPQVSAAMAHVPLRFEPNVGQTDAQVDFVARGAGYGAFLTREALVLSLPRSTNIAVAGKAGFDLDAAPSRRREPETEALPPAVVRMRLSGADMSRPVGEVPIETKTNYFIGDDPAGWHTDVPNFARVRYTDVYPGVDLVFYGDGGGLEYDVVVAPGADASALTIDWDGAETVATDETGALVLTVDGGELRMLAPVVYQEAKKGRTPVAGSFEPFDGGRVALRLGAYDPAKPLVIDPVLAYSTFLGGSNGTTVINAIAVDRSGAAYVTGFTQASDFPTASDPTVLGGPYDSTYEETTAFVTKLNAAGNALVYSTYLGRYAYGYGLVVDAWGDAIVAGYTGSDFPTVRAFDSTFNAGVGGDAFVAKLNPTGNSLIFSTYLGGTGVDSAMALAVDSQGAIYLTGTTNSTNFPTVNAFHATLNAGSVDTFVTKFRPFSMSDPALILDYSTYLGGSAEDTPTSIAADASGRAFVVGYTFSVDFPLQRAIDASGDVNVDGFVSTFSADGTRLDFSTYLGGSDDDLVNAVELDSAGSIYVTGYTGSLEFPTTRGAYDTTRDGLTDAFVTKMRPGSVFGPAYVLDYSTLLGGTSSDFGLDIVVTSSGFIYVAGGSFSTDFPTANAYDSTANGQLDVFVTKMNSNGGAPIYSTYLGGMDYEQPTSLAVGTTGAAYVAGYTRSTNFPTAGAYDSTFSGSNYDGFIAKLQ